ncbi:MAG TPA: hypothetical protein VGB37_16395 [Candidatus Lokiarchaeia archaeon]
MEMQNNNNKQYYTFSAFPTWVGGWFSRMLKHTHTFSFLNLIYIIIPLTSHFLAIYNTKNDYENDEKIEKMIKRIKKQMKEQKKIEEWL